MSQSLSDAVLMLESDFESVQLRKSLPDVLGSPGDPPTQAGKFILRAYAQKIVQGHRDTDDEERYKGTALAAYMARIRTYQNVARYWAR